MPARLSDPRGRLPCGASVGSRVGAIADRAAIPNLRPPPAPRRPVGVKPPLRRLLRFAVAASRCPAVPTRLFAAMRLSARPCGPVVSAKQMAAHGLIRAQGVKAALTPISPSHARIGAFIEEIYNADRLALRARLQITNRLRGRTSEKCRPGPNDHDRLVTELACLTDGVQCDAL